MSAWHSHEMAGEEALVWDGCDEAIVGVACRCGRDGLFVYDYYLLMQVFIDQGMSEQEAVEWIDHNIASAWLGDGTPLLLYGLNP